VAKHAEKEIDLKEEIEKAKLIRRMKLEEEERERQEREKRRKRSRSRSRGRRWAPLIIYHIFFTVTVATHGRLLSQRRTAGKPIPVING
jgi:hypothetical protein